MRQGGRYIERLVEYAWKPHRDLLAQKTYRGPRVLGICVHNRGVWLHRIILRQYYFNSIYYTTDRQYIQTCIFDKIHIYIYICIQTIYIRDFRQYYFNSIPSTSHTCPARARGRRARGLLLLLSLRLLLLLLLTNAAEWTAGEKERNRPASLSYSVTWQELVNIIVIMIIRQPLKTGTTSKQHT